jgi:hypothetical protein
MKNIMVIDGAENCVYDIFATPDDDFALIFPEGTDIAFIEDIERRADADLVFEALKRTWPNRIAKREAVGITGSCSTSCTPSASTTQLCAMRKLSIPAVRLSVSNTPQPVWPNDGPDSQ